MAMQTTGSNREAEPMMEMNMTPLIDVLLVLLIMFIITIPPQAHAVKLDLPQNDPNVIPPPIDPIKNKKICPKSTSAATWTRPINASAEPCLPCSARALRGLASFRCRLRAPPLSGFRSVNSWQCKPLARTEKPSR